MSAQRVLNAATIALNLAAGAQVRSQILRFGMDQAPGLSHTENSSSPSPMISSGTLFYTTFNKTPRIRVRLGVTGRSHPESSSPCSESLTLPV